MSWLYVINYGLAIFLLDLLTNQAWKYPAPSIYNSLDASNSL